MIKILIPLDGSILAEQALKHAVSIAKTFPAELILLRVTADSDNGAIARMDSVDFALSRVQAQMYLNELIDQYANEHLTISSEVTEGNTADAIVKFMRKNKPDLVVLTRYGRGNAHSFATGGTAQKIVSSARCSVLLLDPRKPIDPKQSYHRILVPIDDSKSSDCAVAVATMLAEIHGASLLLLHITEEPRLPKGMPDTRHAHQLMDEIHRIIRREAGRRLQELAAKIPKRITVETRALVASDVSFAVESTATDHDSDLVMLHTDDVGEQNGRRYSSVNQSLIQYSHRPLFILQPSAGEGFASNFRSIYLDEQRREAG
ncbi:MAG: nucleotide-binding universal stress UspA family protein [Gammaproteobacteria bacterium]|jgi:nucleotide-binding universal stress UspA family protein